LKKIQVGKLYDIEGCLASPVAEYYMQVDGRMSRCEGVSAEGALKKAKNEAERLHKTVWLYEGTGTGFFLKSVCRPPHKYIKWGTFKFSTERVVAKGPVWKKPSEDE